MQNVPEDQNKMVIDDKLPPFSWERKLNSQAKTPSEFKLSKRDHMHLVISSFLWLKLILIRDIFLNEESSFLL
jgi:hypothetical protein